MSDRLPISVCLISGAEVRRIGRTLESLSGWAAEILVVLNAEVNDGTEELCLQYGARVFREPWKGHIAQKNSAADKATQPWVLGVDADEVVTAGLRDEIRRTLADPAMTARCTAFSMPRCSWYLGRWIRHGDWYPDRKTRLWKRGQGRWVGEDPHDRLEASGEVGRLNEDLQHYSYTGIAHHLSKLQIYSDIFVRESLAAGKRPRPLDAWIRPPWRFLRGYVFRAGFLDGWPGFVIAWMSSVLAFLKYAKLREAVAAQRAEGHTS